MKSVLFSLLLFFAVMANAQSSQIFNPQKANQTLDKLGIELSIVNVNPSNLQSAVNALSTLREQAKVCVNHATDELTELNLVFKAQESPTDLTRLTESQTIFQNRKKEINDRMSKCQLFILRSTDAINAYNKTINKLTQKALFKIEPHIVANLKNSITIIKSSWRAFRYDTLHQQFQFASYSYASIVMLILLSAALWYGTFLISRILKKAIQNYSSQTFYGKLYLGSLTTFNQCKRLLSYSIFLSFFSLIHAWVTTDLSLLNMLIISTTTLFIYNYIITTVLCPPAPAESITELQPQNAKALLNRLRTLGALVFIGIISFEIFKEQALPLPAIQLARSIYLILLSINIALILTLVNRSPKLLGRFSRLKYLINILIYGLLSAIVICELIGLSQFARFLTRSALLSMALTFAGWFAYKVLNALLDTLTSDQLPIQDKLRYHLGLKPHQVLPEMFWIRAAIYISVWSAVILALLRIWLFNEIEFYHFITSLREGVMVGNVLIVPSKIIIAFFIFAGLLTLVRFIRQRISSRKIRNIDRTAQQSLAAIAGYVGIVIAFLVALIFAGVSFAGLAIIAGALSVGIGFGLQNIVNNFVSGLVLLIERPIRPGDRVHVGATEGHIQKVSLRYTQIRTLKKADIIVPNSEMVNAQVTNYMFQDSFSRVEVKVGVAYGSDTALVFDTLKEVVSSHPEVIMDDPTHPTKILFKEFGDSSLNFEVWAIIKNVNLRFNVASDLHFAIDKAFREKGITIAFPQRDLHIKNTTAIPIEEKK